MSRYIAISDDAYRRLKRERGNRSFSELIADTLEDGGQLAYVTGQQIIDPDTVRQVTGVEADVSLALVGGVDNPGPNSYYE